MEIYKNKINNPFFSVIVPIYKVEQYLTKCIDSIIGQTFQDFELILVDDGSPDACPQMCDSYVAQDSRIRVIHKPNGGQADARNVGLTAMSGGLAAKDDGGYVIFIDSDDYFCDNMLFEKLHTRIANFGEDVVLYGCKNVFLDGTEEVTRGNYDLSVLNVHNKVTTLNYLWQSNNIPGSAWIYSVKRSLIRKHNLTFTKGVTAEDFEWIMSCLVLCNHIGAIDGVHYAYIKRAGSITTQSRLSGIWGLRCALDRYYSYNKRYIALDRFMARVYLLAVMSYADLPECDKKEAAQILNQYTMILKDARQSLYYWFVRILGFSLSSAAIRFAYNKVR